MSTIANFLCQPRLLRLLAYFAWILFLPRSGLAGRPLALNQYAHATWRVQDGSFTGAANAVVQTKDGYLWFGTDAGLFRFDGAKFLHWIDPDTKKSYDTSIYALLATSDGSLLIGGGSELGLLKNGHLSNYRIGGRINAFSEGADGEVWFARSRTPDPPLCRFFKGKTDCIGPAQHFDCRFGLALLRGRGGLLWLADAGRLCSWDGKRGQSFSLDDPGSQVITQGVDALALGNDESLWVGLMHGKRHSGLLSMDHGIWKSPKIPGLDPSKLEVTALGIDREAGLWIGTESQGLFHWHSQLLEHFDISNGLTGDNVIGIYEDREGSIWASTTGGVDRFHSLKISTFTKKEGLGADDVSGIFSDSGRSVWVGNRNSFAVIADGGVAGSVQNIAVPGHKVTTLLVTSDGEHLLGVDDELVLYDRGRLRKLRADAKNPLGTVRSMLEDKSKKVWVLTAAGHLYRLEANHSLQLVSQSRVLYMAADNASGLWTWNKKADLVHYVDGVPGAPSSFAQKEVAYSVLGAADGSVWLSGSKGLHVSADGHESTLSSVNGLPCNPVYSTMQDNAGDAWLYTACGIVRVSGAELTAWIDSPSRRVKLSVFDSADGAQPGPPNFGPAAGRTQSGRLWFANDYSLQSVNPSNLALNAQPPPIEIESLIADHQTYTSNGTVQLPPKTRDVEIDYAGLSLVSPWKNKFRYKLSGIDRDWEQVTSRREAFFMNLPPGSYIFQVIGSNNDGIWNTAGATIRFVIPPTLPQTIWFKVILAALCLLSIFLLVRSRTRATARLIRAQLSERLFERERIARELHDTLLQGFQGLLLRFETATRKIPDSEQARKMMESALDRADEVLIEGRNRVRALRSEGMIVQDLLESFAMIGRSMKADESLNFEVTTEGIPRNLHLIVKDEAYWIGREALINAFTHSQARNVKARLCFAKKGLILTWTDDGKGIDKETLGKGREGHWGLQGMHERAQEIGAALVILSGPETGTSIELRVPASIAYQRTGLQSWSERIKKVLCGAP